MSPKPRKPPSWGNVSEHHWSVARAGRNEEALDYYRERSRAPGVREGGGSRNCYCLACDGVIPLDRPLDACPHCGEPLDLHVRRYFNWVEIDEPPESDLRALLPAAVVVAIVVLVVGVLVLVW